PPAALRRRVRGAQDTVPGARALDENRPDLLAVDGLGCSGPAVANEPGDLLDRNASIGHQRDEAVPQFPRSPRPGVEPGRLDHLAELAADVRCIPWRAYSGGEPKIVFLPPAASSPFQAILARPGLGPGSHAALRERERPP